MIKNKLIILCFIFTVSLIYSSCTQEKYNHAPGVKKLYNIPLSMYGWSDSRADEIIKVIGYDAFNKVYKYIFITQENIEFTKAKLQDNEGIILEKEYIGIPITTEPPNFEYVFFSDGAIPFEVDLKKIQQKAAF